MDYAQELRRLADIGDSLKKRSRFMGILSREMRRREAKAPVIVGGHAVEVFTQGGYFTTDIDVKAPRKAMEAVLSEMGFRFSGTHYINEELDIYIQWLGEGPDPRSENPDKLIQVDLGQGLFMRLIGFEDLAIDRLCAYKFWKDSDSLIWASRVLGAALSGQAVMLDMDYLRKRAKEEDVLDVLDLALRDADASEK